MEVGVQLSGLEGFHCFRLGSYTSTFPIGREMEIKWAVVNKSGSYMEMLGLHFLYVRGIESNFSSIFFYKSCHSSFNGNFVYILAVVISSISLHSITISG